MNPASKSARVRVATEDSALSTPSKVLIFVPVLLVALWVASIFYHSERVVPREVHTVKDFYRRYGDPPRAATFRKTGVAYYRLIGEISAPLAFPAGPPHYIFDYMGRLTDWTPEINKDVAFQEKWTTSNEQRVTITELVSRFPKS
ncbi:MAG: hypothetical protein WA771_15575 [Chthoniobacterales bacterium]